MPRPKLKPLTAIKTKGFAMNPGSKNIDSPGVFSLNNTNTISSLNTDPKKKRYVLESEIKAATEGTKEVGYLGGELGEVVLTGKKKKPKKKSFREKHGYTRVGGIIDDIKYGRVIKRPLNWGTLTGRKKERRQRKIGR